MCAFSRPSAPPPVVVPDPPPPVAAPDPAPQASDPQVQASRDADRQKRLRAAGNNNTLVTGGQGLVDNTPATGLKTAFGA